MTDKTKNHADYKMIDDPITGGRRAAIALCHCNLPLTPEEIEAFRKWGVSLGYQTPHTIAFLRRFLPVIERLDREREAHAVSRDSLRKMTVQLADENRALTAELAAERERADKAEAELRANAE